MPTGVSELADRFRATIATLKSYGVFVGKESKLYRYQQALDKERDTKFVDLPDDRRQELYVSLHQAREVCEIVDGMATASAAEKRRLACLTTGPFRPDKGKHDVHRDYQYELFLRGLLWDRWIPARLANEPDLSFSLFGEDIYVSAKRPRHYKSSRDAIARAVRGFNSRPALQNNPWVLAVSLDLVLTPRLVFRTAKTYSDAVFGNRETNGHTLQKRWTPLATSFEEPMSVA